MDTQTFYAVDPERLNIPVLGTSLQERRDRLRSVLQGYGAEWASLRTRSQDLLAILHRLGALLGTGEELADLTFENSPFNILPLGEVEQYNPFFGYFGPHRVQEYNQLLSGLSEDTLDEFRKTDDGISARVLWAYMSSLKQAVSRDWAVAIDHG